MEISAEKSMVRVSLHFIFKTKTKNKNLKGYRSSHGLGGTVNEGGAYVLTSVLCSLQPGEEGCGLVK